MSEHHEPVADADELRASLTRYLESGDEVAMEVIVSRTRRALLRVARRIGAPQDAEDAVQTAYFSLLRKRGQKLDIPVMPWLKTAVVRIAYRQKAKQKKQHELAIRLSRPRDTATPLEKIVSADEIVRVRQAIARLPSTYRDPVVLRYLQGLSTAETSDLLEVPEATVRTRLHRARRLLEGRLPTPVSYGLLCLPWFVADVARSIRGSLLKFAAGTSAPAPVAAVAVLVAGGLGAATGALLPFGPEGPPRHGDGGPAAMVPSLEKSVRRIRRESREIQARRHEYAQRIRTALSLLAVVGGEIRARTHAATVEIADLGPLGPPPVRIPEHDEILARLDWTVLGATARELVATIASIGRSRIAKEPIGAATAGRAQELNGIMIQATARIEKDLPERELGLVNINPAYLVNVFVSALSAAGHPPSEEQTNALEREARAATAAEAFARVRDREIEFAVERHHALAQRRKAFLESVARMLTETQREILWPEAIRGRLVADLLSVAHAYHPGVMILSVRRPQQFRDRVLDGLARNLCLSPEERATTRELVDEWIATLPARILAATDDPLEPYGWVLLDRVEAMAAPTARLYRLLRARLGLEGRRLRWIEDQAGVIIPLVCCPG